MSSKGCVAMLAGDECRGALVDKGIVARAEQRANVAQTLISRQLSKEIQENESQCLAEEASFEFISYKADATKQEGIDKEFFLVGVASIVAFTEKHLRERLHDVDGQAQEGDVPELSNRELEGRCLCTRSFCDLQKVEDSGGLSMFNLAETQLESVAYPTMHKRLAETTSNPQRRSFFGFTLDKGPDNQGFTTRAVAYLAASAS